MPTYVPFEETPYNRLHVYDHYLGHCSEELVKYLPFRPGLTVLDYACGNGGILGYLLPRTGQAWGMTPTRPAGKLVSLSARMAIAHIEYLPLADASLDAVILHDLGDEIGMPARCAAMLREVARTLRGGGYLLWLMERQGGAGAQAMLDLFGFDLQAGEPLNYLTVPAVSLLGRIPGLRASMPGKAMMKLVTAIDGVLAKSKTFSRYSHHVIVVAQRR